MATAQDHIRDAHTALGLELGSTRIKAVLIGPDHVPLASGGHEWTNQFVNRVWTYDLADVWAGLQACFRDLAGQVRANHGVELDRVGAIGVSAMMHGYLAFDASDELLTPFRTWRNTTTGQASERLTELFDYNIPQRWSISHLYQAILGGEPHVPDVRYITTLAGYVHWQLTGRRVLGVGDASGMFPIANGTGDFNEEMITQFDDLVAEHGFGWKLRDILPRVLVAGDEAGALTEAGARLLDPSGVLRPGIPMAPPEGDAGTGMTATNSVAVRTGNVSAGTSIFAMAVLEHDLQRVHPELDLVSTPSGELVAMVHCNNCTSDLNAWVGLFGEFAAELGLSVDADTLFGTLYRKALDGDADGGGLLAYNYLSGEHITGLHEGRPLFVRSPDSRFTLANFMRTHLFSSLGALRVGMDVLLEQEHVQLDSMFGHGGLFRTEGVGQRILAAAIDTPVSVGAVAGEGGAWGMAILAEFMQNRAPDEPLESYLQQRVFSDAAISTLAPDPVDVAGFNEFMGRYRRGLAIERAAVESL